MYRVGIFFTRGSKCFLWWWQCGCNIGQLLILVFVELGFWSFTFLHRDWVELCESSFTELRRSGRLHTRILWSQKLERFGTGPKSSNLHFEEKNEALTARSRIEPGQVGCNISVISELSYGSCSH